MVIHEVSASLQLCAVSSGMLTQLLHHLSLVSPQTLELFLTLMQTFANSLARSAWNAPPPAQLILEVDVEMINERTFAVCIYVQAEAGKSLLSLWCFNKNTYVFQSKFQAMGDPELGLHNPFPCVSQSRPSQIVSVPWSQAGTRHQSDEKHESNTLEYEVGRGIEKMLWVYCVFSVSGRCSRIPLFIMKCSHVLEMCYAGERRRRRRKKQRVDVLDIQTLTLLSEPERRGRHLAAPYKE